MDNTLLNSILKMSNLNPETTYDENGRAVSSDPELNKVLQEVQDESGPLGAVIPAVAFEEDPDGENKVYIALASMYEKDTTFWFTMTGRQAFYRALVSLVKAEEIDPNESFVIAGDKTEDPVTGKSNVKINDMTPITVFRFLKSMRDSNKVIDADTDFDIDEYADTSENGDLTILEIG